MGKIIRRKTKLLTEHGRGRFDSRVKKIGDIDSEIIKVKKYGKDFSWFTGELRKYLNSKSRKSSRTQLLVYDNKLYILDYYSQKLITVFDLPEKYLPTENYLLTPVQRIIILKKDKYLKKEVEVQCKPKKYEGTLDRIFYSEYDGYILELQDFNNKLVKIKLKDIIGIVLIKEIQVKNLSKKIFYHLCLNRTVTFKKDNKTVLGIVTKKKEENSTYMICIKEPYKETLYWIELDDDTNNFTIFDIHKRDIFNPENKNCFSKDIVLPYCKNNYVEIMCNNEIIKGFVKKISTYENQKEKFYTIKDTQGNKFVIEESKIQKVNIINDSINIKADYEQAICKLQIDEIKRLPQYKEYVSYNDSYYSKLKSDYQNLIGKDIENKKLQLEIIEERMELEKLKKISDDFWNCDLIGQEVKYKKLREFVVVSYKKDEVINIRFLDEPEKNIQIKHLTNKDSKLNFMDDEINQKFLDFLDIIEEKEFYKDKILRNELQLRNKMKEE